MRTTLFIFREHGENHRITPAAQRGATGSVRLENYAVGSCLNRKSMLHGGSLILIKNGFKFKQRNDIVGPSVEHCVKLSCVELDR